MFCATDDLDKRNQVRRIEGMANNAAFGYRRQSGGSRLHEADELEEMITSAGGNSSKAADEASS
jgi:hypothetical protein